MRLPSVNSYRKIGTQFLTTLGMKGMINKDMQDRDPSPSLGMTANKGVTRVAMALRRAHRHRYPILQKPHVIPNEA